MAPKKDVKAKATAVVKKDAKPKKEKKVKDPNAVSAHWPRPPRTGLPACGCTLLSICCRCDT